MNELKSDIKSKNFGKVYLLFGEEHFLTKKYERELVAATGAVPEIFDGAVDADDVINAAETVSFFDEKRVILSRDGGWFEKGAEKLADFVKNLSDDCVIIFSERENVDKRSKLFKRVSESGRAVEFKRPDEKDLIKWLKTVVSEAGAKIEAGVAALMIRRVGSDMNALFSEANKAAAFRAGEEISADDVREICSQTVEARVFDMVDAIGGKDAARALDILAAMILMKEAPLKLLTLIARQFRLMYGCKRLTERGSGIDAIAARLEIKPFVARECLRQSRNFDETTLLSALNDCLEADLAIKSGRITDTLALEMLIAEYGR